MLTPRENLLAMLRGECPQRLPFQISLTPPVADALEARTGSRDPVERLGCDIGQLDPDFSEDPKAWQAAYAAIGVNLPPNHEVIRIGITFVYPETRGTAYHLAQFVHTLADVEDVPQLERLPWPDPADPRHYAGVPEEVAAIKARGR
jgi:hypothetical protein